MRRGVSPVIAILLLIAIAVAVGILTYVWVTGYISSLVNMPTGIENLIIESYYVNGNTLTLYIRNVGGIPATIDTIYLMNQEFVRTTLSSVVVINPGDVVSVNVDISGLSSGRYLVKVVTRRGSLFWAQIRI